MKEKPSTKICKYCKTEIPYDAKICPNCRKKQKMGLIPKILLVILALAIIVAIFGGDSDVEPKTTSNNVSEKASETVKEEPIEYIVDDVSNMNTILKDNAMKAENTYNGKYVEVTGILTTIDSDGKYFCVDESDFDLYGVQCRFKNEDQKQVIMNHSRGDTITVRVKITDVGEVLGYMADTIEFVD